LAFNVANFAGATNLADVEHQKKASQTGSSEAGQVGHAISSAVSPPPGFGGGAGAAMGVLSLLTGGSGSSGTQTYNPVIWAWVPVDIAPTYDDAKEKIGDIVKEAVIKTFDPDKKLETKEVVFKGSLFGETHRQVLTMPNCQTIKNDHGVFYEKNCSASVSIDFNLNHSRQFKDQIPAPPFLGINGNVYGPIDVIIREDGMFKEKLHPETPYERLGSANNWIEISKNLPSWIYILMPSIINTEPYILSSGNEYKFGETIN
jgi:hypothetical protein